ncbi:D-methionine transport system substrate-binding protein [Bacillus ectoiniformans]|uniref:MetQ/NlpA family ABC transporter substrate-binding protein n=1 Tax=Bacillus ectoiniformans TaxID=1494429 RepID=UPI00195C4BEA|nr:MetQ/NlpA family ABC transporter substrate-binding protein [Bacillus ectoiniformans]MBM7647355.1 D-methionine transport system substrate-binding protein [Bacillus ectoiniformans]
MKKYLWSFILILAVGLLSACGGEEKKEEAEANDSKKEKIVVGVTAGPHEQVVEKVKEVAAKDGFDIELKVFNEYVMPNVALDEGELDLNSFQHDPYLEQFKADRNLDLTNIADTVNFPMGIYSNKLKSVEDIKKGSKIGLPNDPTNGARALLLFEQAGLIKLKKDAGVKATVKDVEENKLDLELIELEASQIPRQLDELDAAAINTNFAVEHGFTPAKDSIYIEPKESPWVNVVAVRTEDKDAEFAKKFIKYYHTDEVKQFIEEEFSGSVIPSW